MSFKHPEFLWALMALLIPVIIHLFNFRRYKKFWFSNIRFLKDITTETRKQNRLKQLILLLTRMLAIMLIVLAFAGPEINRNDRFSEQVNALVAIYVDNSFSMMSEGQNGRLFEESLKLAGKLVQQMPKDRQFLLIDNDRTSGHKLMSKEATLAELNNISISPGTRNISSVLRTVEKTRKEKGFDRSELYLLSDFQKYAFDADDFPEDSLGIYYFMPLELLEKKNIYIDSCWITAPVVLPDRPVDMKIRLKSDAESDYNKIPLKVMVNGQQKAVAGVDLKAGSTKIVTVNFTPYQTGWHKGIAEIEDYPVIFDDQLFFAFKVQQQINILEINNGDSDDVIRKFYQTDKVFRFETMDYRKVDYNSLQDFNLIILNALPDISTGLINQISEAVNTGRNVLFIPKAGEISPGYNRFLKAFGAGTISGPDTSKTRVVRINRQSEMFREAVVDVPENADFPVVFEHNQYHYAVTSGLERLMTLLNGDDFLLKKSYGNGLLYLLAAPIGSAYSNFSSNALFVPVLFNAAVQGKSTNRLFYTIGKDNTFTTDLSFLPDDETPFSLKLEGSEFSMIPEQKVTRGKLTLSLYDGIQEAGFYNLSKPDSVYSVFAFNYSRQESQMNFLSPDQLNQELSNTQLTYYRVLGESSNNLASVIKTLQKENDLWKLFIIFALFMLLAEILILRFWK